MQPAVRRRAGCAGAEMIITDKHQWSKPDEDDEDDEDDDDDDEEPRHHSTIPAMPLQLGSDIFRAIDLTLACDVAFSVSFQMDAGSGWTPNILFVKLRGFYWEIPFLNWPNLSKAYFCWGDPAFLGAEIFSQDGKLVRSPPQGNVWLRAPVGERISEVIWGTKKANFGAMIYLWNMVIQTGALLIWTSLWQSNKNILVLIDTRVLADHQLNLYIGSSFDPSRVNPAVSITLEHGC